MTTDTKTKALVQRSAESTMTVRDLKWNVYVPIGISVTLLMVFYSLIFRSWYGNWMMNESYYSHGILVPFISLFIVWLKKKDLAEVPVRPSAVGYFILVPLLALVSIMLMAGSNTAGGLAFPLIVASMVLILFGWQMLRETAFPIGYLYFMCVLPGFLLVKLSFTIQIVSTMVATVLLHLIGLDAYRTGVMISLPNIEVMVGAPCSGFRLLISLLAFAVLFAYLREGPLWGRLFLVAFTAPLSLIVNSLRIAMIALVGEYMGSDTMHSFHDYSGYIVLVLAFIILWFISRLVKCQKFNSKLIP